MSTILTNDNEYTIDFEKRCLMVLAEKQAGKDLW